MTDIDAHDAHDAHDVAALGALFDADFTRATPDLTCTRLIVSPVNSDRILEVIGSAHTELLVESMQLADSKVRDALVARKAAGVTVRVILADPRRIGEPEPDVARQESRGRPRRDRGRQHRDDARHVRE